MTDFLDDLPLNERRNCWYQLDGAPAHSTNEVSRELYGMFDDRWIGRIGPWNWPPRSPDLTPLDFYFWGRIKEAVYITPIDTKQELQARVRRAFQECDQAVIQRSTTNHVMTSINECLRVNGHHFKHLRN